MRTLKIIALCFSLLLAGPCALRANPLESSSKEKLVSVYTSQIGVREATGNNDGVMVEAYLKTVGFEKGYSWCAAFVTWSFEQTSKDIKTAHSAWAPSWFPTKNTIYIKGKLNRAKPDKADVFGIFYPNENRIGHVGFIDEWPPNENYVITVEGNTSNGVYRKRRLKANIYKVSRWI